VPNVVVRELPERPQTLHLKDVVGLPDHILTVTVRKLDRHHTHPVVLSGRDDVGDISHNGCNLVAAELITTRNGFGRHGFTALSAAVTKHISHDNSLEEKGATRRPTPGRSLDISYHQQKGNMKMITASV
jgi:hypothetical protein